uniref:Uncharacterized protein n=1 Tax=Corethron hystrix TaxID=216773 RepID=A0A7S1BT06_9STRA|mmetsp:Transcript_38936/g.90597  ORF Transcript_38936/g.90597 Transcript_38936/m.90597 type:complete len:652 (+) Transcript_38936:110-2065(+)
MRSTTARPVPRLALVLPCLAALVRGTTAFAPPSGVRSNRRRETLRRVLAAASDPSGPDPLDPRRRRLLAAPWLSVLSPSLLPCPALAQLVQFPPRGDFLNIYHFMRAGESVHLSQGIVATNALYLTNREENSLTPRGEAQVREAVQMLKSEAMAPTLVEYSIAANAMDSANVAAAELLIGRSRMLPEFTNLDPRAIGSWDGLDLEATEAALWALDFDEAGADGSGPGSRPPGNEDGTPHETLIDQVVRLRQLMSLLETYYSGDTILLIFPDGTGPAVLTALIGGLPLNRVHELELRPGEIRTNVTPASARALLPPEPPEEVLATIRRGRRELERLRKDPGGPVRITDRRLQEDVDEELERQRGAADRRRREEEEARALLNKKVRARAEEERVKKERARLRKEEDRREKELSRARAKEEWQKRELDKRTETNGEGGFDLTNVALPLGGVALSGALAAAFGKEEEEAPEGAVGRSVRQDEPGNTLDPTDMEVAPSTEAKDGSTDQLSRNKNDALAAGAENRTASAVPVADEMLQTAGAPTTTSREAMNDETGKANLAKEISNVIMLQERDPAEGEADVASQSSSPESSSAEEEVEAEIKAAMEAEADERLTPSPAPYMSPDEQAALAMEEYINRDDGFNDYSGLLVDMLDDDE